MKPTPEQRLQVVVNDPVVNNLMDDSSYTRNGVWATMLAKAVMDADPLVKWQEVALEANHDAIARYQELRHEDSKLLEKHGVKRQETPPHLVKMAEKIGMLVREKDARVR